MKKKQFCPHCGQPIMRHTHVFSKALGNILLKIARKYELGEPFHLQKDLELSKNEYANFQKLRYWGLAEKCFVDGIRLCGYWMLTEKAESLLHGYPINRALITFNNNVVEKSDDLTTLSGATGSFEIPEKWAKRASIHTDEIQQEMKF